MSMARADSQHPIVVDGVWKQYQRGVLHHRMGDALTGWWRRLREGPAAEGGDGKFWALKDVSFSVARGETLGIIGHNGAGKSTMLKLLSGISKPTKGLIRVRGKLAALIEVGAGFHPDLTGRENIYLNGAILGLRRKDISRVFDRIVEFSEVERFIDTPVKRYSSGMYVRLGFSIAVHINPEVLLIDEVLSVGDLAFQQKCLQRIHEMKQQGTTMVFISHNLNAVQRVCDRVLLLASGQVVKEGEGESVIKAYRERVVEREREWFHKLQAQQAQGGSRTEAQIDTVRLVDGAGWPADTVELGRPFAVEVEYACARPIEHPTIRVVIERSDGLVCHVASTQFNDDAVPPLYGHGVVRLEYPSITLLPNAYRISVELGEQGRSVPLDARRHGAFFSVTSHRQGGGAVHLEHEWHWDHNSATDRGEEAW